MAVDTQQLELPARLEPYGSSDWLNVEGTNGLHNIVQLEQRLTDGIVTIFDAWTDDGGVDGYRFYHGVNAIGNELVDSSISVTNDRMLSDGYVFVTPSSSGRYWGARINGLHCLRRERPKSAIAPHSNSPKR